MPVCFPDWNLAVVEPKVFCNQNGYVPFEAQLVFKDIKNYKITDLTGFKIDFNSDITLLIRSNVKDVIKQIGCKDTFKHIYAEFLDNETSEPVFAIDLLTQGNVDLTDDTKNKPFEFKKHIGKKIRIKWTTISR